MMNKRGFLLGAASAVAAPQVLAGSAASAYTSVAADGQPLLAASPRLAAWQAYLSQSFELSDGLRHWAVRLETVDAVDALAGPVATEQFALGFVNQGATPIPAGLHRLQHANGQSLLIHLADHSLATRQSLRADFNLLLQTA